MQASTARRCLALALLLAAGCATVPPLPPFSATPTNDFTPGRIVWHDLVTQDMVAAKRFYGEIFGWTFRDVPISGGQYALASLDGAPVAGIITAPAGTKVSQWVSYFSVEDVGASIDVVKAAGGKVWLGPVDIPGRGRAALVTDSEGAPLALAHATGGDPPVAPVPLQGWLWADLWTRNAEAAGVFYGKLFGYQVNSVPAPLEPRPYTVFQREGTSFGGLLAIPAGLDGVKPNWLPMLRVKDVRGPVSRATELGGRVILAPRADLRNGTVAILADPSGAAVSLQQRDGPVATHAPSPESRR
jgi:predicted enzyme related to lactoylglutathione lyase